MKPADDREEVLFREARQRPAGLEREAYLDEACAGNEALRRRLTALLRADESPDPFLDPPVGAFRQNPGAPSSQPSTVPSALITEKPGDKIGRKCYELFSCRKICGSGATTFLPHCRAGVVFCGRIAALAS